MQGIYLENGTTQLKDLPTPAPKADEALVRVSMAGVCNTDLELMKGYMGFEGVLGHEFVGVVDQCSKGDWRGKRVCGEINFGCGTCGFCARGLERHCPNRTVLGILNQNGAFAESVVIPCANLISVPDTISDSAAVFVEPLAAAFEILEQVQIQPKDRVAVVGDGKLGLLICQVLLLTGCELTLTGKHESKLAIARSWGLEARNKDEVTEGEFDLVVEASGSAAGFATALELLRPRGTLVLKSTYAGKLELDAAPIVINEITVIGSRCGLFAPATRALARNQVRVDELVDAVFPFEQAAEALARAALPGTLKVLLQVNG